MPQTRCPSSTIDAAGRFQAAHVKGLLAVYAQYDGRNVLPAPGGWNDQAAGFAAVVKFIDTERGWWEEKRSEKMARDRKAATMKHQSAKIGRA